LIEQWAHLPVAVRRAVTVVDAGALVVPKTCAHPGRQALGRGKRRRRGADFRDDLLPRIDTETRNGRESLHGILVHAESQQRLCRRFRRLAKHHKPAPKIAVAIARELAGFVWAALQPVPTPTGEAAAGR